MLCPNEVPQLRDLVSVDNINVGNGMCLIQPASNPHKTQEPTGEGRFCAVQHLQEHVKHAANMDLQTSPVN